MSINAVVRNQVPIRAKTALIGQNTKLIHLGDIDSTELADGSLLVYNASTEKFQTKSELDNSSTIINGGKY